MSVGFEQTSYQTSENGSLNEEVCAVIGNLMGDLECDLTVTFGAVSNDKTGEFHASIQWWGTLQFMFLNLFIWIIVLGEDFTVVPPDIFEATFFAMSTSNGDTACDIVTIIDDEVLEGEHSFEILITTTDPQLVDINPASAFVTIADNEGMTNEVHNTM